MIEYIKDYFATNFDTRRRFHIDHYCYDGDIYVFSYGFSSMLIEAEIKNRCVNFRLSNIAVGIFSLLINNNIEFNFAFVDLRHKEDEEMTFRDIIKNPKVKYKLNAPYRIIERQLYCIR